MPLPASTPVDRRQQEQAVRLGRPLELVARDRLVRDDGALDAGPRLEVGRRVGDAKLDHPDRFSFPFRFA